MIEYDKNFLKLDELAIPYRKINSNEFIELYLTENITGSPFSNSKYTLVVSAKDGFYLIENKKFKILKEFVNELNLQEKIFVSSPKEISQIKKNFVKFKKLKEFT
jgi:hypothetical protein